METKNPTIRVLLVGDVVGKPGREAFRVIAPRLREREGIHFTVVNAENAAGGSGLTDKAVSQLLAAGADVITTGDHIWRNKEIFSFIADQPRLLRPANLPPGSPGRGSGVFTTASGAEIGVVNLLGRVFMKPIDCPFRQCDRELESLSRRTPIILVDFHAEATSEKQALGYYCDGRVSALYGTHTHVPTADERVLEGGTAYITDLGMTGASKSVLGREIEPVLKNFTTGLPAYFAVAGGEPVLEGAIVEIDPTVGRALSIRRVREEPAG
ncbi:MAG: TIGR00282 family metallophosphoesterase [Candidatus Erginobacter occultus]|nr:TIGR00282 family metallophosphoesterase [Candidatus Erginobacter occultus]